MDVDDDDDYDQDTIQKTRNNFIIRRIRMLIVPEKFFLPSKQESTHRHQHHPSTPHHLLHPYTPPSPIITSSIRILLYQQVIISGQK